MPPTWWPLLLVAESSQHDQIRTGNRRGLHGLPDLKLLDFGRRCSAFSREMSWAAASLLGTFETCRRTLKMSAYRGKTEVIGTPLERRD